MDINAASDELLLAFLQAQGVLADSAATLLDELRDWQDFDDIPREHGAEMGNYRNRGLDVAPRNGPLESVEELQQIPSWRAQDLDCWKDSLTVYTGQSSVDVTGSTAQTAAALKWLETHGSEAGDRNATIQSIAASSNGKSVLGEVFRIRATASLSKEVTATAEWVGRLTGDPHKPILTMRWDHDLPPESAATCRFDTHVAVVP
jgi:general secretion pathway protein K